MKNVTKLLIGTFVISTIVLADSCKKDDNEDTVKTAVTLYYSNYDIASVNKIDLENPLNSPVTLYDPDNGLTAYPTGIAVANEGYLIISEEGGSRILKAKADGSGPVIELYTSADGVSSPSALAIDNSTGTIYWNNSGTDQIMKGNVSGTGSATAMYGGATVLDYAYGLAIDKASNKIYFADFDGYIKVGNLDGTGTPEILWDTNNSSLDSPSNICIDSDHNKIYWTDEGNDNVSVGNLDGTGTPVILYDNADGIDRADAIGIDYNSNLIYWSETNNMVIAKAKLDGTGTREVLISGIEAYSMVLEFN